MAYDFDRTMLHKSCLHNLLFLASLRMPPPLPLHRPSNSAVRNLTKIEFVTRSRNRPNERECAHQPHIRPVTSQVRQMTSLGVKELVTFSY